MAVPSSVSISTSKSVSFWLSWADGSRVNDSAQGRDVCKYAYLASKLTILERWAPEVLPVGAGGILGRGGISSGVSCLRRLGGGTPVSIYLQRVYRFFRGPFWQGRHPVVWFWRSIVVCLSITAFIFLCPGNSTPRLFSSQTSVWDFLIRCSISSIAEQDNPPLAILAILKARHMSDCSRCTRPPCLAIVADKLHTYKKLVAASNNKMQLLPQPYTLP